MAIYNWSALNNGDVFGGGGANPPTFDPLLDQLVFDDAGISAAGIFFQFISGSSSAFSYGGKTVTLNAAPETLATTNVTFANGSQLLIGDNTTGTANDSAANSLTGTSGDDQFVGLGGNDTLNGGAGNDTATYIDASSGYNFQFTGGNIVITDTNTVAGGNEGADTLINIETASFSDGTVKVVSVDDSHVNTFTPSFQIFPAITALSNGGFVVTWQSNLQDGSNYGVYAQRFDAGGAAHGCRQSSTEARIASSFIATIYVNHRMFTFNGIEASPNSGFSPLHWPCHMGSPRTS